MSIRGMMRSKSKKQGRESTWVLQSPRILFGQARRNKLNSVPFAIVARDVNGIINPAGINIGGVPVIDAQGRWVGSTTGIAGPRGETGPAGPQGPQAPVIPMWIYVLIGLFLHQGKPSVIRQMSFGTD